jgi:hypothetical protein
MNRNPRLVLGSFLAQTEALDAAQAAEVTRVFRVPSQSIVASVNFGQQEMGIVHSSAFLLLLVGWRQRTDAVTSTWCSRCAAAARCAGCGAPMSDGRRVRRRSGVGPESAAPGRAGEGGADECAHAGWFAGSFILCVHRSPPVISLVSHTVAHARPPMQASFRRRAVQSGRCRSRSNSSCPVAI